jgi:SAM-dependent methyltransferase
MSGRETVGAHYQGEAGAEYFAWQEDLGRLGAEIDAPFKYAPHVASTDVVVDFGCGGGYMLERVEAAERIGIEPNPHARAAGESRGLRMLASPSELDPGFADVVLSHHALEHSRSPFEELEALRRVLKPTGKLVLWLPLDDWRTREQRRPTGPDRNQHLFGWTPRLLWNLLEGAGFAVESVDVVTHAWPPMSGMLIRRLRRSQYDALAHAWSRVRRRRQLVAIARPQPGDS